ncbi:DUF3000 domain-containing protein [Bounagaea algeriensis]
MTEMSEVEEYFRQAVTALLSPPVRAEVALTEITPPKRLAPWSYALGAEATGPAEEQATARLVLLYDPEGQQGWDGHLRLALYLLAELDPELAADPLLPTVGWSWLTDALEEAQASHRALGGTVTLTSSSRFGAITGPARSHDLELRASWTAPDAHLEPHARAFHALLGYASGLPPEGVAVLGRRSDG